MKTDEYISKKSFTIIIVIVCLIALDLILFIPWGHDSNYHVMRLGQEAVLLKDNGLSGIPFRIYPDVYNGYGYGSPMFYCDLFFFPFALLVSAGIDVVMGYRIMAAGIFLCAFIVSYICVYQWKKDRTFALLGAFLYVIQPYFLLDLFTRAAFGEALALCFEPLVVFGTYAVFNRQEVRPFKGILFLGIGMGLCLLSHLISSFLIVIALVFVCLINLKKVFSDFSILGRILLSALLCLALTAWFWIPMLQQFLAIRFKAFGHNDYFMNNVMNLYEMLVPYKIRCMFSSDPDSLLWFAGGAILSPLFVIIIAVRQGLLKRSPASGWLVGAIVVLSVVMISRPICKFLYPVIGNIRLPWRLLVLVTICSVLLSLFLMEQKNPAVTRNVLLVTVFVSLYAMSYQMLSSTAHALLPDFFPPSNEKIVYSVDNGDDLYLPEEVDTDYIALRGPVVTANHSETEFTYSVEKYRVFVTVKSNPQNDLILEFPRIFYKGYSASLPELKTSVPAEISPNGLVSIRVPENYTGTIDLSFTGTALMKAGDYLSLGILLLLAAYSVIYFINSKKSKKPRSSV